MKKILLTTFFCLGMKVLFAQNTAYFDRTKHIFGQIDKSKVSTGLLKDYGICFNDFPAYNGILQANNYTDNVQWQSLYQSLFSMRVGTATMMTDFETISANVNTLQTNNPSTVFLIAQYYTYQQYKATAYTNGDVKVTNDQITDVSGRNPYDIKNAAALFLSKTSLTGNTFSFQLNSDMIFSNTTKTLSSTSVDFGNGGGYIPITLGVKKDITYTSGGVKEIKLKFSYSDGTVIYSHSNIDIAYIPASASSRLLNAASMETFDIISQKSHLGAKSSCIMTVNYANGQKKMLKPLIIVEGIDPFNKMDYEAFIGRSNSAKIDLGSGTKVSITDALTNLGFDLVFVDFKNSVDYIERNAYVVEEVISKVNALKLVSGSTEKNVILGISMGGVVSRYALRDMEQNSTSHQTRLYISQDSPHQGANVPLAFQGLLRHLAGEQIGWPIFFGLYTVELGSLGDYLPELQKSIDILESPGVKQMLIYQATGTGSSLAVNTNPDSKAFYTKYSNMGLPKLEGIRNVAISNGSECGRQLPFTPYSDMLTIDDTYNISWIADIFIGLLQINPPKALLNALSFNSDLKVYFNCKSLPDRQAQQIYYGRIWIKRMVLGIIKIEESIVNARSLNSTATMLPLDNAGGGTFGLSEFGNISAIQSNFVQKRFNFIPTYSALDVYGGKTTITIADLNRNYYGNSTPLSQNIPFTNFITSPIISENHVATTKINGTWLFKEIIGQPITSNCFSQCATNVSALTIAGPSTVCNTTEVLTFSIQSVADATYLWEPSSDFILESASGQGTTTLRVKAKAITSNVGTIRLIVGGAGCNNVELTKTVQLGRYSPSQITVSGTSGVCRDQVLTYRGNIFVGTYTWSKPNNWTISSAAGNWVNVYTPAYSTPDGGILSASITNQCGTSGYSGITVYPINCGGGSFRLRSEEKMEAIDSVSVVSIYPNPVNNILTIDHNWDKLGENEDEIEIEIINLSGVRLYHKRLNYTSEKIDVSSYKIGIYILKVSGRSHQLIEEFRVY